MSTNAKKKAEALAKQAEQAKLNNIIANQNIPDDIEEDDIFDILSGYTKKVSDEDEFQGVTPISTVAKFLEDDGYIEFDENNFRRPEKALMVDLINVKRDKKLRVFCSVSLGADVRAGNVSDDDLIHLSFGEKTTKSGEKALVLMNERGQKVRSLAKSTAPKKSKPKLSFDDLMKGL